MDEALPDNDPDIPIDIGPIELEPPGPEQRIIDDIRAWPIKLVPSPEPVLEVEEELLTRDQVAFKYGIPFAECVSQLNALMRLVPSKFTFDLDAKSIVTLCKPEAVRQLLSERAARGEISNSPSGKQAKDRQERETRRAVRKFDVFSEQMRSGEYEKIEDFHKLIKLLGQESSFDILLHFSKEYKDGKVPVEHVHGLLTEMLGDFVADRGTIDFDALGEVVEYFNDVTLQQALVEVAKREVLRKYDAARAELKTYGSKTDNGQITDSFENFELLADIVGDLYDECALLDEPNLNACMAQVGEYYLDLQTMDLPTNMVINDFTDKRPFPDLNQRINIKEIMDKRRMLIADAPGMGKSLSFIMAKELRQAKLGVIFAPKQVQEQESWQDYLSDKIDPETGEQIGYFKEGEAPSYLVVNGPRDLLDAEPGEYKYIIISHEKVTLKNLQQLRRLGVDMACIDEAHLFKNILEGVRPDWIIEFCEELEDLVLLTATPAPNKVTDIALILKLLFPDDFKYKPDGEELTNADLVRSIMESNMLDIRRKLLRNTQMKRPEAMRDHQEPLIIHNDIELTKAEKEAYAVVLEDWEMTSSVKLQVLRQISMNTKLLAGVPEMGSAKLNKLIANLEEAVAEGRSKQIIFVDDYVDEIITLRNGKHDESKLIINDLKQVFPDMAIELIHGDVKPSQRREIRRRFQKTDEPMIMVVSGSTVSVGVDFNRADDQHHINRPWTKDQLDQEIGRSNRFGRVGQLRVHFYDSLGTIEWGMRAYIEAKHRAVLKLLHGVPMTSIDRELVMSSEQKPSDVAEVNPDLARYYISVIEEMERRIFGAIKEKGETWFKGFIENHGDKYAEVYTHLTSRSYQANCSRLAGTIIKRLEDERSEIRPNQPLVVVDAGSGPEMLRRHSPNERIRDAVVSIDLNKDHFEGVPAARYHVAPMSSMPLKDNSADVVNVSLALHYTSWWPGNKADPDSHERLKVLSEINRVLKLGGHAIITMPYSLNIRDDAQFRDVITKLGFSVEERYTGRIQHQNHFKAQTFTLKKTAHCDTNLPTLTQKIGSALKNGLRLQNSMRKPVDTRRFATQYTFETSEGRHTIDAELNEADKLIRDEEQETLAEMERLRKSTHGKTIDEIKPEDIESRGWVRIWVHDKFLLYKQLTTGDGAIVYRDVKKK